MTGRDIAIRAGSAAVLAPLAIAGLWLGGWAFEQFGTHWIAFGAAAMLLLVAACVSLLLPSKLKP